MSDGCPIDKAALPEDLNPSDSPATGAPESQQPLVPSIQVPLINKLGRQYSQYTAMSKAPGEAAAPAAISEVALHGSCH